MRAKRAMKKTNICRAALILPVFLGFAFAAKANVPTLTMTEVSATTLTYSWNGADPQSGIATESSPDHWTFSISDNVVSSLGGDQNVNLYWEEPDYATSFLVNYVNFYVHGGNGSTITVVSDTAQSEGYPTVASGVTYNFYTESPYVSGGNLAVFNDLGDSVPDGGSSAMLLGLGVVALGVLRRRSNSVRRCDRKMSY